MTKKNAQNRKTKLKKENIALNQYPDLHTNVATVTFSLRLG